MSVAPLVLTETISRGIVLPLFSQFSSVAQALLELVDNPIDYADGQELKIEIIVDKAGDRIIVASSGGLGMGPEELQRWLAWGDARHHVESDIGAYAQGGKAACGYLANRVRLWTKRAGAAEIWMLEDAGWRSRGELREFGILQPVSAKEAPEKVVAEDLGRGHVRIELNDCVANRRWNTEQLRRQLSSVYSEMLRSGSLSILLNGKSVAAAKIKIDRVVPRVRLRFQQGSVTATGWAGKLDRSGSEESIKSGLRLYSKGRLIQENVWFGFNWLGKGSYNQLIGELKISGLTPNLNKSAYVEQDDEIWHLMGEEIIAQLQPLLIRLRSSGDHRPVTKKEQQLATQVRQELEEALRSNASEDQLGGTLACGRKPAGEEPRKSSRRTSEPTGRTNKPRTPKPRGAVGDLRRVGPGLRIPEVVVTSWDSLARSALTDSHGSLHLRVNKAFPGYTLTGGSKFYLAETVLLEVLSADEDVRAAGDLYSQLTSLLHRWAEETSRP